MQRIVTIQDISCVGKCSLTVGAADHFGDGRGNSDHPDGGVVDPYDVSELYIS